MTPAPLQFGHAPSEFALKRAGFTELLVWSVEVKANGDLNLNGEFPIVTNGKYVGAQTWPKFAHFSRPGTRGRSASSPSPARFTRSRIP